LEKNLFFSKARTPLIIKKVVMQRVSAFQKEFHKAYSDTLKGFVKVFHEEAWSALYNRADKIPALSLSFESIQCIRGQAELDAVIDWLSQRPITKPFLRVVLRLVEKFASAEWAQVKEEKATKDKKEQLDKTYLLENLDWWLPRKPHIKRTGADPADRFLLADVERQNAVTAFRARYPLIKDALVCIVLSLHYYATLLLENQQLPACCGLPAKPNKQNLRVARLMLPRKTNNFAEELCTHLFFNHYSAKPRPEIKMVSLTEILEETSKLYAAVERKFNTEDVLVSLCETRLALNFMRDEAAKLSHRELLGWIRGILAQESHLCAAQLGGRVSRAFYSILLAVSEKFELSVRTRNKLPLRRLE
jgi:hypothetical protein